MTKNQLVDLGALDPRAVAVLWRLGFISPNELKDLAALWLSDGRDLGSPEIATIAMGMAEEIWSALQAGLREMGLAALSHEQETQLSLILATDWMIVEPTFASKAFGALESVYYSRGNVQIAHPDEPQNKPSEYALSELGLETLLCLIWEYRDLLEDEHLASYNKTTPEKHLSEVVAEARKLNDHYRRHFPKMAALAPQASSSMSQ